MRSTGRTVLICALCALPAWAATPGIAVREAPLRSTPAFNAAAMRTLAAGTSLTLLERRGGWREVVAAPDNARGWVREYQVRPGQPSQATVERARDTQRGVLSDLAALSRSATGLFGAGERGGGTQTTATIGVRGLGVAELEAAEPDAAQLSKLKTYAVKREAGQRFAAQGGLRASRVAELRGER